MSPPRKLFRIGFGDDPSRLRPRETVSPQHPFDGRWDDPFGEYRVLYTCSTREGAYREKLQDYRPSNELLAAMKEVAQDDPEFSPDKFGDFGVLPRSWLEDNTIAEITVDDCDVVKVTDGAALDLIQTRLGYRLDASTILSADKDITRAISRMIFRDEESFAGIAAESKLGTDSMNYAFFESGTRTDTLRVSVTDVHVEKITEDDPALVDVINAFGLRLAGYVGVVGAAGPISMGDCRFDELVEHVIAAMREHGCDFQAERSAESARWASQDRYVTLTQISKDLVEFSGEQMISDDELNAHGLVALQGEFALPKRSCRINVAEADYIARWICDYLRTPERLAQHDITTEEEGFAPEDQP